MDDVPVLVRTRALKYDGRTGELYAIFLLNLLLTVLTLGIFRFWAITRYRRYFWSRMSFQGQRFEYTGRGGELFVGYLLAGLVLIGAILVAVAAGYGLMLIWQPLGAIPVLLYYAGVSVLAAGAVFSAQRYRLSRTLWCGIRGGMTGSMAGYGMRSVLTMLLAVVTMFQMMPWRQIRLAEWRINASSFGTASFRFQGRARAVYGAYVLTFIVTMLLFAGIAGVAYGVAHALVPRLASLGGPMAPATRAAMVQTVIYVAGSAFLVFSVLAALVTCWYTALFERHILGHTTLGGLRFASSMSGGGLLGLAFGNMLITLFTLGFGLPIVMHRNARFLSRTLWVQGALDPAAVEQSTLGAPRFGEGMFQQLDATGWM